MTDLFNFSPLGLVVLNVYAIITQYSYSRMAWSYEIVSTMGCPLLLERISRSFFGCHVFQ